MNDEEYYVMHYAVMRDKRLSLSAVIVYAVMFTSKSENNESQVTVQELIKLTKQSERTVRRAIKQLKDANYLTSIMQGQGKNAIYILKEQDFWDL